MDNVICGWNIANSFLKKSFEERISITITKLNCLVYLLYSDYLYLFNCKLCNETFIKTDNGPVLPTIYAKFSSFGESIINRFACDSTGRIFMIKNTTDFENRLGYIWDWYKNISDVEMLDFVNQLIGEKANGQHLYDIDILEAEINRREEILKRQRERLEAAKNNLVQLKQLSGLQQSDVTFNEVITKKYRLN